MYLYFDVNGNLKEIINYPVREGNDNVNKIYVYVEPSSNLVTKIDNEDYEDYDWESEPTEDSVNVFTLPNIFDTWEAVFKITNSDTILNPNNQGETIADSNIIKQIPFDKERDLKYFKYFKYYQFIVIPLTSDITQYSGRCDCSVSLINTDPSRIEYLDTFSFFIQSSVVIKDVTITSAQYQYLYAEIKNIEEGTGLYVPYTGADENVNLGSHELTANKVNVGGLTIQELSEGAYQIDANYQDTLNLDFAEVDIGGNKIVVEEDLSDYVLKNADANIDMNGYDLEDIGDIKFSDDSSIVIHNSDMVIASTGGHIIIHPDGQLYVDSSQSDNQVVVKGDLSDYATLATNQEITGNKEFTGDVTVGEGSFYIENDDNSYKIELKQVSTVTGNRTIELPDDDGTVALTKQLPTQGLCASFSTSDFTLDTDHYVISNVTVSNFITGSNILVITWDNCFAICPIPQTGAGRVCAAMWNADGESQIIRIKYELKTNNTLLDISLSGGFVPPSGHTAYVFCYKLFN